MNRPIATVLGGNGFIGRQVVERLVSRGYFVRVACRRPSDAVSLRKLGRGTSVLPVYASVTDTLTLQTALKSADVSVNLVSILTETGGATFNAINAHAAGRVARVAQAEGVRRHVHVSAIGAEHNAPSMYGRSKAEGEGRVRAVFPEATIVRPSVVFGPEDRFLNMFGLMARLSPVLPVFCPDTRLQPVYVGDVAEAIVRSLVDEGAPPPLVEVGGPDIVTMRQLMGFVAEQVGWKHTFLVPVPMAVARLQARVFERLPGKLLTQDQLAMLAVDNVVSGHDVATLKTLGIKPTSMANVAPAYLRENGLFRSTRHG